MGDELKVYEPNHIKKIYVRSGIRTHAHRSGLRPERSALDLSAILTMYFSFRKYKPYYVPPSFQLGSVDIETKVLPFIP